MRFQNENELVWTMAGLRERVIDPESCALYLRYHWPISEFQKARPSAKTFQWVFSYFING